MSPRFLTARQLKNFLGAYKQSGQVAGRSLDSPFFRLLNATDEAYLCQHFYQCDAKAGEIIFCEGEAGDSMYLIWSGQVAVFKGDLDDPLVLGYRGAGEIIGEMSVLDDFPRSASVVALTDLRLFGITREKLQQFLGATPDCGWQIMLLLSSRLREADGARSQNAIGQRRLQDQVTHLQIEKQRLEETQRLMQEQAIRDPLTGLFNRRYLNEMLEGIFSAAKRNQQPVGLILFDIDHFKDINDAFGHHAGDWVLQALGKMITDSIRKEDLAFRIGGDEFIIIMPGASLEDTCQRAEQIRQTVATLTDALPDGQGCLTLSAGVVAYPLHGTEYDTLYHRMDQALYQAKQEGRNRVVVFDNSAAHCCNDEQRGD